MKIDVVIPVYRPTEKFVRVMQGIQNQTCQPEHIILMHTEDGFDLSQMTEKRLIPVMEVPVRREDFDHGGTRNVGIQRSQADVVICMTQDAIPLNERLFEQLIEVLEREADVAVAYARQVPDMRSEGLGQYATAFNYPKQSRIKSIQDVSELGIKTFFCSNVCAAYRREVHQTMKGFESPIIFNEDMVFAAQVMKAGYRIAYVAEAVVMHSHQYTRKQQMQRNFDLGVSQSCYPEIFQKIPSEKEGIRLLKYGIVCMIKKGRFLQIGSFFVECFCKYVGYQMGKHYEKLPFFFIQKMTMNSVYWKRGEKGHEKEK